MLNIMGNLCEANNFTVHGFESGLEGIRCKIAVPAEENANQEYYLFLQCELAGDDFIERLISEHIEKMMDELESMEYTDESFRKNSTLILCCEDGHFSDTSLLKFEEDPYFFKKNVITFHKEQLSSLNTELNNQFSNNYLNELLMNDGGDLFESFKTQHLDSNNYYPLLLKLMTKLPFVHYIPQPNQLDDLNAFVRNELNQSDLKLLDFICDRNGALSTDIIDKKVSSEWGEL